MFGVSIGKMVPSLNVVDRLTAGQEYPVTVQVTGMDVKKHQLAPQQGLTVQLYSLVVEYSIHVHPGPGLDGDINREATETVWLPLAPVDDGHMLSPSEIAVLGPKISRAEAALGPMYAYVSSTLTPDPSAGNRLAPMGRFQDEAGWASILYQRFVGTIKPSGKTDGGMWLNLKIKRRENVTHAEQSEANRYGVEAPVNAATVPPTDANTTAGDPGVGDPGYPDIMVGDSGNPDIPF